MMVVVVTIKGEIQVSWVGAINEHGAFRTDKAGDSLWDREREREREISFSHE